MTSAPDTLSADPSDRVSPFDRIMSWIIPVVAAATPLVVIRSLKTPDVGQAYFFIAVVCAAAAAQGAAWALGWSPFPRRWRLPFWLVALNAVSVLASLPQSQNAWFSLRQLRLPLAGALFLMLIAVAPARRRALTRATAALILVGAVLAVFGIAQYFGVQIPGVVYTEQIHKNVVNATIGHPNHLSSVLGPIVFLTVGMFYGWRRNWLAIPALGLVLLSLCCIVLARTRSIWLGLLVGAFAMGVGGVCYMLRNRAARPLLSRVGLSALIALGGLAVFGVLVSMVGHGIDLQERLGSKKEISSRFFYWNAAIDMGRRRPLFGNGYAMFDPGFWNYALDHQKSPMGKYYSDAMPAISGTNPGHAHNEYLEVFCEQGLFGLVALLAFMGYFLYYGWLRLMREPDALAAMQQLAVFCALVLTLVDAALSFPWRLPVSMMVLVIVLGWMIEFMNRPPAPAINAPRGLL